MRIEPYSSEITSALQCFGRNLKAARKAKGLTQMDLAVLLDTHYLTVGNWERGETEPPIRMKERLAITLDVKLDDVLAEWMVYEPRKAEEES